MSDNLLDRARVMIATETESNERWRALARELVAEIEANNAELGGDRVCHAALLSAVEVIKTWHNMPVPGSPVRFGDKQMETTWRIYYDNAPEMKAIREAIKSEKP